MMFLACCYNDPDMLIDPDTVYPTRPDCTDAPKSRFKPQAINLLRFFLPNLSAVPCIIIYSYIQSNYL